jgi:hypothetical protein
MKTALSRYVLKCVAMNMCRSCRLTFTLFFLQICDFGLARIVDPATMSHSQEDGSSDDEDKRRSSADPPESFGTKPVREIGRKIV